MYDIRFNPKFKKQIEDAYSKSLLINKVNVTINEDKAVTDAEQAVIMVQTGEGKLVEWGFRGLKNILGFINNGYIPIQKYCPLLKKTCIGIKCSLYVVQRDIGDCAHVWTALK